MRRRTGTELEYFLRVFWVPAAAFVAAEAVTVITSSTELSKRAAQNLDLQHVVCAQMLAFLVRRASFFVPTA